MKENSDQKICDKIIEYADLKDQKTLEIGCGNGRISSLLSAKTNSLTAVDPDEEAIRKARAHVPGVDFRIGSGEALNFPTAYFDVVLFTLSLHHQNAQKALSEAARVLRKDGEILVVEPLAEGEIEIICSFLHNENQEKALAQECIDQSGLKIEKSEVFTAEWVFENESDLFKYLFDYYDLPFNYDIAQKISHYLGEKIYAKPIICEDKMIIQRLKVENQQTDNKWKLH